MNILFAVVTAFLTLAALLQGIVAFKELKANSGRIWLACTVICLVLAIISGFTSYALTPQPGPQPGLTPTAPHSTPPPPIAANPSSTVTTAPPPLTPTASPTVPPTSTETPLASDGKHAVSIHLTCTSCSDPILVTITSINIQSQLNRMQWTITLVNTGPYYASISFGYFYLLEGDQTNITNPVPPSQGLDGEPVASEINLSPSGTSTDHSTTIVTFSFVPHATSYTLESRLDNCPVGCQLIHFDPKLIPFNFH